MRYHFKIHKAREGGYWAHSLEEGLGVTTQGDTLEELKTNLQDALDLALDEPENSKWLPPLPDPALKGRNVLEVAVNPRLALATMVRRERLEAGLSQRQAAARMGIKHLRQYQKLEDGRLANAELETLAKLKALYPRLSVDAVLA